MRIFFNSLTLPKKAAKRVQNHFDDFKLSHAQELTAQMLGYDSWHELDRVSKRPNTVPSPLDEDVAPEEQSRRINYQTDILSYVSPLIEPVLRRVAIELRVSAKNPLSPILSERILDVNRIQFFKDPYSGQEEWRFFPSSRSSEVFDEMDGLYYRWENQKINFGDYSDSLNALLAKQPENIYVITEILRLAIEMDDIYFADEHLSHFEKTIEASIPADFPRRKKVYFEWGTVENRPFHRAVLWLAECFYRKGKFTKAKKWFNFSNKTCAGMKEYCYPFLLDLRRDTPRGRGHETPPEDRYSMEDEGL